MSKVTRREFLEGTSATLLASSSANAQEPPTGPYFVPDGSRYTLKWRDTDIFHVDPAVVMPGEVQARPTTKKLLIVGTTGPEVRSVEFAIVQSGGEWKIDATWRFASLPEIVATVAVPTSPCPITFESKLDARQLATLVKHLSGGRIVSARDAVLHFEVNSQRTELIAGPGQEFSAFEKKLSGQGLLLAPLPKSTSVQLIHDKPSVLIDVAKEKHLQLKLRAAKHAKASFGPDRHTIEGFVELQLHSPRCDTTHIPCRSISSTLVSGNRTWTITPTDDIWRLNTPKTSFEARVAPDGTQQPCARPIEITTRDGKLKNFCVHTRLVSTSLALENVDRTRFDLGEIPLQLANTLPPVAKTPPFVRPTPVFAYAAPDTPLRIPLPDYAKLRLWRGLDLFCLAFQFHNIDLSLGKKIQLIPLSCGEIDPASKPDEAVLLAEFPPQHIMERTFLRQDRPPPDAGEEISPAQLRKLQRLEAGGIKPYDPKCTLSGTSEPNPDTDAQCLRKKIQGEKIAAESRDFLGDRPPTNPPDPKDIFFPFASFAKAWDGQYGDTLGLWIGPAGLFSLMARRSARLLVAKLKSARLNELIAKAPPQKFEKKDFDDAAEILVRPHFPMTRAEVFDWIKKDRQDKTDPLTRGHLKALWQEATTRSDDFRVFQKFNPNQDNPASHNWLLFPDWPFTDKELKSIYQKASFTLSEDPDTQREKKMQEALIGRLKEFKTAQADTLRDGQTIDDVPEGFRRPVEAWISAPSRLAFVMNNGPIGLTVTELTAWESFELRVVQRARRLYGKPKELIEESSPAKILADQGIKTWDKAGAERVSEIVGTMQKPGDFDTALEIPTGLILSPAQDALWITPKKLPPRLDGSPNGTPPTPVWQALLLERQKKSSLRAVWSQHFDAFARDTFLNAPKSDDLKLLEKWKDPNGISYSTAMSPQDQAELVALTSMYGLPVIASKDKEVSSQIEPPSEDGKKYITDADPDPKSPYAIYMPVPLQARRLALGATGGMLDLDTTFPLVTSARTKNKNDPGYFKSFSLQRWRSLISDGSDVITTVVRRGYLFPLGHKASLIKVTEPRLRPIDPDKPSLGYSVEQATRIYIEVTRASHQYPAVAQSFEARDFQPRDITLLTLRTPDLVDSSDDKPLNDPMPLAGTPEDTAENRLKKINEILEMPAKAAPHGRIRGWVDRRDPQENPSPGPLIGQLAGIVFWPRTEVGTRGTVRFRMRIDGQPTPVSMPMIFADHRAASDPATMKALAKYYRGEEVAYQEKKRKEQEKQQQQKPESNGQQKPDDPEKNTTWDSDKPKEWNKVQHNGALRTYADEQNKGQCTFVTDWQLLEAVKGDSEFAFNSELVAAEQPPFYPRMAGAQVRPQQIQGLTGSTAPILQVAYERNYVTNGFNPPESCEIADPETFLRVTNDPPPKLDMGAHGDQGGAVARPAKFICGLNRRFGIAGPPLPAFRDCSTIPDAKPSQQALPEQPAAPRAPAGSPAATARFDSTQVLPPRAPTCSVEAAPRKYENKDLAMGHFGDDAKLFGLISLRDFIAAITGELGEHIPKLEEITSFTGDALANLAKELKQPIEALIAQLKENAGDVLFPDFTCALQSFQLGLQGLASIDKNNTPAQIEAATPIWASGQRVVRELETIARAPISQFADRLRYYLISSQADIAKRFLEFAPWNEIQKQLAELVAKAAANAPEALVTILDARATASDLQNLSEDIKAAVTDPEVWRKPKPLDEIARRVSPLPNGIIGLREGPLYELAESLTALAQQNLGSAFDAARLSEALKWAAGAIDKAYAVQKQVDDLVGLTSAACDQGIESLRKLPAAFVDNSVPNASVKIRRLIGVINDIKDRLPANPGDLAGVVQQMKDYLDEWVALLQAGAGKLDSAITRTTTLARRATGSLPTNLLPLMCRRFDIASIQMLAALNKERQDLLNIWLDFAAFLPTLHSPPVLPPRTPALLPIWQDVQTQMIQFLRSAMTDAETAALRNVTSLGAAPWKDATDEIDKLVAALPFPEMKAVLNGALQARNKAADTLGAVQKELDRQLTVIASGQSPDLAAIHKLAKEGVAVAAGGVVTTVKDAAAEVVSKAEDDLLDKLARPSMAYLLTKFKPNLDEAAENVLKQISTVYDAILSERNQAYRNVRERLGSEQNPSTGVFKLIAKLFGTPTNVDDACTESWDKFLLLVPNNAGGGCPDETNDALKTEADDIRDNRKTADDLKYVLDLWQEGKSAPQRILKHLEYFARIGIRSNITKVLDVEDLRQRIAAALADALPTTKMLKSSLSLPLKETSVGIGTFRPTGEKPLLTLDGKATINLLDPTSPTTDVNGHVTEFEIDILSIMTFSFRKGVTYAKGANEGQAKIIAPLGAEDIKFGDKLSFFADLSKSLSFGGDGDGNGPYTIVHIDNPSIEAGYRISIPVITLGATFTNVNFAGAIVLPFTNGSARVRAALGSLDNQFMISVGIYGGSGFMAIEASPRGIEAFEASFQFGGIASIGYGPLQGTAYVTTGAYVRKDELGCTFAALFSAGFTAHIACFGISAAFTLRLYKRAGDSSVSGEAALTFTFSIGRFIKISYTIRVGRSMQAGFGGGGKEAAFLPGSGVQVAALGNFTPSCFPEPQAAILVTTSLSPQETWSAFEAQFDPAFLPEALK
jgi:hypothetical protein